MHDLPPDSRPVWDNFRTDRYAGLNAMRWDLFLKTGLTIAGKTVFEPGAGIGDQTEWLLSQGAARVIVSDGRESNVEIIRQRFADDSRVTVLRGDLESCLDLPEFQLTADMVFLWGCYYHINDPLDGFPVLTKLARIAPVVALDYLESATGENWLESYGYDNPSASISHSSWRQTPQTMAAGVRGAFGYAYWPTEQMNWHDPLAASAPRRIIVGSRVPLNLPGLQLA